MAARRMLCAVVDIELLIKIRIERSFLSFSGSTRTPPVQLEPHHLDQGSRPGAICQQNARARLHESNAQRVKEPPWQYAGTCISETHASALELPLANCFFSSAIAGSSLGTPW